MTSAARKDMEALCKPPFVWEPGEASEMRDLQLGLKAGGGATGGQGDLRGRAPRWKPGGTKVMR